MGTKQLIISIAVVIILSVTTACPADEIILNPIDDTWVNNSSTSTNYDDNYAGISATSASIAPKYPYFRFDLSGISGTLTSAQLRLYVNSITCLQLSIGAIGIKQRHP